MNPPYQRNGVRYAFIDGRQQCIGSCMGRRDHIPDDYLTVKELSLARVPIDDGGYDPGGAYWGIGDPMYVAFGDSETEQAEVWFRARESADAVAQAVAAFPNARVTTESQ